MIQITEENLRELLATAFDKGWTGYCDLKESVIQELLERCEEFAKAYKGCQSIVCQPIGTWSNNPIVYNGAVGTHSWTISGSTGFTGSAGEPPSSSS